MFTALAEPSRRLVIGVLARDGSATSTGIAGELEITRQAVAKHLAALSAAGLVSARRAGRETQYRLATGPLRLASRWLAAAAGDWDDQLGLLASAVAEPRLAAAVAERPGDPGEAS